MLTLENGAVPVRFVGTFVHGVVLARWGGEYCVWRFGFPDRTKPAVCTDGQYFKLLTDGIENFRRRTENFF